MITPVRTLDTLFTEEAEGSEVKGRSWTQHWNCHLTPGSGMVIRRPHATGFGLSTGSLAKYLPLGWGGD